MKPHKPSENYRYRKEPDAGFGNTVKDIPDYLMSVALRELLGRELSIALDIFLSDYVLNTSYYKEYLKLKSEDRTPPWLTSWQTGQLDLALEMEHAEKESYAKLNALLLGLATFPYQLEGRPDLVTLLLHDYIKYASLRTRRTDKVIKAVNRIREQVINKELSHDS